MIAKDNLPITWNKIPRFPYLFQTSKSKIGIILHNDTGFVRTRSKAGVKTCKYRFLNILTFNSWKSDNIKSLKEFRIRFAEFIPSVFSLG